MELIEKISVLVEEIKADGVKFYEKGNKSAGTRVRKTSQELKKLLQELRIDVLENTKNNAG
jgi:hypothetical protein